MPEYRLSFLDRQTRQFPTFALGVGLGLLKAVTTEPDMLILAISGLLLGSKRPRARGIGGALILWFISRRTDQYVWSIGSKVDTLSRVIRGG